MGKCGEKKKEIVKSQEKNLAIRKSDYTCKLTACLLSVYSLIPQKELSQ